MARKQKPQRPKHVPQRTCIACRDVAGKRGLIRIVRTADGVNVDQTGKVAGRGAYLHPSRACWEQVLETRRLDQALRTKISPADRQALADFMADLPDKANSVADSVADSATGSVTPPVAAPDNGSD